MSRNIYLTADLHFGHENIIKYCNRPFNDVHEMNNTLINNWNSIVNEDDLIFCLGDFSFREADRYAKYLNGEIILIRGNHDRSSNIKKITVKNSMELILKKKLMSILNSEKKKKKSIPN